MAHLGTAELVSAVSNAGGLGIIGAAYYEPDWVRQQIRSTRQRTSKPFGLNIVMKSPFIEPVIAVVLEEEVDLFGRGRTYMGEIEGNVEEGSLVSGQVAGLIKDIKPAEAIIDEIATGAEAIIAGLENFCSEN